MSMTNDECFALAMEAIARRMQGRPQHDIVSVFDGCDSDDWNSIVQTLITAAATFAGQLADLHGNSIDEAAAGIRSLPLFSSIDDLDTPKDEQ